MLPKVPWNLRDVAIVYMVRVTAGLLLVQIVFPILFGQTSSSMIELADRLIMLGLVWFVVRRHGSSLHSFLMGPHRLGRNITAGLLAGVFLLAVSRYSESLYATAFFATPDRHPLVAQVEQALSWEQLLMPLLLAGLAAPVAEEFLYRLLTFMPLRDRLGVWGGALTSAIVFAVLHFNAYWLAETVIVGVGLALLYYWTGSLLSSIVAHSFINTTKIIMLFVGVPLV